MQFGWIPKQNTIESSSYVIEILPDFEDAVQSVRESGYVQDGWFYVPMQENQNGSSESFAPVPMPWFSLPYTHKIECRNVSVPPELLHFIITVFGWTQGLWLQPEEWGHLSRVAIDPGKLTDFIIFKQDIPRVIDLADAFWNRHRADGIAATLFGAIHWFLISQSYHQYFERFMMQYIVLDTIYKVQASISGRKCNRHAMRTEYLSHSLDVPLPSWGIVNSDSKSELSVIRNDLFHEAKFGGVPIGFGFPSTSGNILVSLQSFNSRLIAALLGATGKYSRSSSETRQRYKFSID